jgi:hypothetical protein
VGDLPTTDSDGAGGMHAGFHLCGYADSRVADAHISGVCSFFSQLTTDLREMKITFGLDLDGRFWSYSIRTATVELQRSRTTIQRFKTNDRALDADWDLKKQETAVIC